MKELGADIAKIAVMPRSARDVLTLLSATEKMKHQENPIPIITVSMSAEGLISRRNFRLCGDVCFGGTQFRAGTDQRGSGGSSVAHDTLGVG